MNFLGAVLSRMYRDVPGKLYGVNIVQYLLCITTLIPKLAVNRGINLLVCGRLTEVRTLYSKSQGWHGMVGHVPVSTLYPFYAMEENVLSPICTMFLLEFGITNVLFITCGRRRIRFGGHRSE
jgi:hypothetical protein